MSPLEFKRGYVYEVHMKAIALIGFVTELRIKGTVIYDSPKEVVFSHGIVVPKDAIVRVTNPPELVREARDAAAIDQAGRHCAG